MHVGMQLRFRKDFGSMELWMIGLNCETWTRSRGGDNALKLVDDIHCLWNK